MGVEKRGGGVKVADGLADHLCDQVGLFGAGMANGDIGLAPGQVADLVRRHHVDLDRRRRVADPLQDRRQVIGRHMIGGRDPDQALDRLGLAGRRQRDAPGRRPHRPEMVEQVEAGPGQGQ